MEVNRLVFGILQALQNANQKTKECGVFGGTLMPCVIHRPYPLTQAGFARIRFAAFEKTPHGGPYGMPGMAITFILITLLPSPFC